MSKTILATVGGFTPVIDSLAREHGLIRAAVFGRIWRYCQLEDGVCRATLTTIAADLNIDKATVMRHAAELVNAGYLDDLTPELKNRPHIYKDTGKAGLSITIAGGVADSNATVAQCNAGVAQSKLSKVFKRQKRNSGANAPDEYQPLNRYAGYKS